MSRSLGPAGRPASDRALALSAALVWVLAVLLMLGAARGEPTPQPCQLEASEVCRAD